MGRYADGAFVLLSALGLLATIVAIVRCYKDVSLRKYVLPFEIIAAGWLLELITSSLVPALVLRVGAVCLAMGGLVVFLKRWSSSDPGHNRVK